MREQCLLGNLCIEDYKRGGGRSLEKNVQGKGLLEYISGRMIGKEKGNEIRKQRGHDLRKWERHEMGIWSREENEKEQKRDVETFAEIFCFNPSQLSLSCR